MGIGLLMWPSKSVQPQHEDILFPNNHSLHSVFTINIQSSKKKPSQIVLLAHIAETLPVSAYFLHWPEIKMSSRI